MADIISTLNDLVETSKDGEKGFQAAAEDAKNAELKTVFTQHAQECAKSASELQQIVSQLGGKPEKHGSLAGALHRGWVDTKSALTTRDDVAILEEVERGEDVAKAKYRKALDEVELPQDVRSVVQRQYDGVLHNHDQIRDLRNRYRAAH